MHMHCLVHDNSADVHLTVARELPMEIGTIKYLLNVHLYSIPAIMNINIYTRNRNVYYHSGRDNM